MENITGLLFPALIFIVFYFFFIRPQAQKQKKQQSFSNDLSKGQEVVTGSGIIGKINKIERGVITLQVDQKTFIRVVAGAISHEMTEGLKADQEKIED